MRNNNLKRFLTTASALAMIAAGAGEASAAVKVAAANPSATATAANWVGGVVPVTGDTIQAAGVHLAMNVNTDVLSLVIDIDNLANVTPRAGANTGTNFTNFISTGGIATAGRTAIIGANGGNAVTLSFDSTSAGLAMGGLLALDALNNGATFTLSPGAGKTIDYTGVTFQSTGGDNGTINVASGTVTLGSFSGAGTGIKSLTVQSGAIAQTSAHLDLWAAGHSDAQLIGTGQLKLNDGHNAVGSIDGSAANNGVLVVAGTSTIAGAGAANGLHTINITGAATKVATFSNTAKAGAGGINITGGGNAVFTAAGAAVETTNGGNFVMNNSSTATITQNNTLIDGYINTTGGGLLTQTAGNVTASGTTLTNGNAIVIGAGGLTASNGHITATLGNITSAGAIMTANAGNLVATAGSITTSGTANTDVNGTTTAATGITLGSAGAATLTGNVAVTGAGDITTGGDATHDTAFGGAVGIANGNFVTGAGKVTVAGATTITTAGKNIEVGTGGLTLGHAVTFANGGTIDLNGHALTLTGADNITATAAGTHSDIVSSAANSTLNLGTLAVAYTGHIKGNIGTSANAINSIALAANGGTNAQITSTASGALTVHATATKMGAGTMLTIDGTNNSITYNGTIDGDTANNSGTLVVTTNGANTVTFTGAIGGTKTLAAFTHKAGTATYKDVVNTQGIVTVTAGTANFNGAVNAGGNVVMAANSKANFGSTVNATSVADVTLTGGGSTATFAGNVNGAVYATDPNGGTATFTTGAITIAGNGANGLGSGTFASGLTAVNLNMGGNTLTVSTGAVNTKALVFQSDDTLNIASGVTIAAPAAGGLGAVTTAKAGTGTLILNANYTTGTNNIGATGLGLKSVQLGSNVGLTVANAQNVYAPITGTASSKVALAGAGTVGNVGTSSAPIAKFSSVGVASVSAAAIDGTNDGSVYANVIDVAGINAVTANATTTFNNTGVTKATTLQSGTTFTNTNAITATTVTAGTTLTNTTAGNSVITATTVTAGGAIDNSNGTITATTIKGTSITNNGGTITLNDGGTLSDVGNGVAAGTINLTNNATIGNIGSVAAPATAVNMNTGTTAGIVKVTGNTLAVTTFTQNGNVLKLTAPVTTVTGATYTVAAASTIDATDGQLIMNTGLHVTNVLTYKVKASDNSLSLLQVNAEPVISGTFNAEVTMSGVSLRSGVLPLFSDAGGVVKVAKIAPAGANITAANITGLNKLGLFVQGTYADASNLAALQAKATNKNIRNPVGVPVTLVEGDVLVILEATPEMVVGSRAGVATANEKGFASAFAAAINSGSATADAAQLIVNLNGMTDSEVGEAVADITDHSGDVNNGTVATSAVTSASQAATAAVSTGMTSRIVTTSAQGVSAGDSADRFGVWAQVVGGQGTQKQRKGLSGFQSRMMGGMVGADTMISDNVSVGMLVSNVNNNVKFKDTNTGDKAQANSWIFGVYGNYDVGTTDFFVQGNLSVAQTAINSKGKKLVTGTAAGAAAKVYQTAKAKYDILGVGADIVGGYKFKFDNSYVAPTVGLRYNYFGDTSYSQTGLTVGNQDIKTKANNMVSGLAGVKIGSSIDMDGTTLMPEAHMNLSYAFNAPSTKTSYKINGLQNTFNYSGPKASRFGANFGAGVMAEAEGFEYGVGYDANIADKYLAHQGSLKVKVKF